MDTLFNLIDQIPINQWHYYYGIDNDFNTNKPFINTKDYSRFIEGYFRKSGKIQVLELCDINSMELRLPNHICSVFFLGILLYNHAFSRIPYQFQKNAPGYATFPFIWFLIALFHDNAYLMEDKNKLKDVSNLKDLINKYNIENLLLDRKFFNSDPLLQSRKNYFLFRKKKYQVVDHGILGGLLLYDRLVKIRQRKESANEDQLFWGKSLEKQYKKAADAISIHNIWLQPKEICIEYNLKKLIDFQAVKFMDSPLFYLLGIVDTIEPLKIYKDCGFSDEYILKNLYFGFGNNSIKVSQAVRSELDFSKLLKQIKYFENWLDMDIKFNDNNFELFFK